MSLSFVQEVRALCRQSAQLALPAREINVAHLHLDLRCDDPNYLEAVQRALACQTAGSNAPAMRLKLVVTDRISQPHLRPPAFRMAERGLGAFIAELEAAGLYGSYDSDHDGWQFYDPKSGAGLQLLSSRGALPPWERAFPLRNFLHWGAVEQDQRLLHAGTLGLKGRGVLLAGAGGAGKSGTVLAGLWHGLETVGDDYVLLDPRDDGFQVKPLMRLAKQDPKGMDRLGVPSHETRFGALNWQGKYEFDFETLRPGAGARQLALKAVFLPQISGGEHSTLRPASAREVLFALLPNNLQQLPGGSAQAMRVIAKIARELPGYHLTLSHNPGEIAATIGRFLKEDLA